MLHRRGVSPRAAIFSFDTRSTPINPAKLCLRRTNVPSPQALYSILQMARPSWLDEYAVWHRQHRNAPAAKYVMYSCHEHMKGIRTVCGGHGSRFNQIGWTLRVVRLHRILSSQVPCEALCIVTHLAHTGGCFGTRAARRLGVSRASGGHARGG